MEYCELDLAIELCSECGCLDAVWGEDGRELVCLAGSGKNEPSCEFYIPRRER